MAIHSKTETITTNMLFNVQSLQDFAELESFSTENVNGPRMHQIRTPSQVHVGLALMINGLYYTPEDPENVTWTLRPRYLALNKALWRAGPL